MTTAPTWAIKKFLVMLVRDGEFQKSCQESSNKNLHSWIIFSLYHQLNKKVAVAIPGHYNINKKVHFIIYSSSLLLIGWNILSKNWNPVKKVWFVCCTSFIDIDGMQAPDCWLPVRAAWLRRIARLSGSSGAEQQGGAVGRNSGHGRRHPVNQRREVV